MFWRRLNTRSHKDITIFVQKIPGGGGHLNPPQIHDNTVTRLYESAVTAWYETPPKYFSYYIEKNMSNRFCRFLKSHRFKSRGGRPLEDKAGCAHVWNNIIWECGGTTEKEASSFKLGNLISILEGNVCLSPRPLLLHGRPGKSYGSDQPKGPTNLGDLT